MKMKRFISLFLVFALLAALLLSGCGSEETELPQEEAPSDLLLGEPVTGKLPEGDALTIDYAPTESVNPLSGTGSTNALLTNLIYETPFTVGKDYTFAPTRLIKDFEFYDEGKTWSFTVDTSVQFSDGTYLSAYDVAYSVRRAMQSSLYRARLDNESVIYGVSAISDEIFMISLHQENMLFPALLTIPVIRNGDYNVRCPIGTGLYRMEGAELWNGLPEDEEEEEGETGENGETGEAAEPEPVQPRLVLNSLHPAAANAMIPEIRLRESGGMENMVADFEDGYIDLLINDPTGFSAMGFGSANEVRSYISPSMYYLGFNMGRDFVLTAQYRYAMNFLIDRKTIVKKLMFGSGVEAVSPIVPTSPYYDESIAEVIHYSPEAALTAFANGGCADHDDDGKLEYMVTGIPMEIRIKFIVNGESGVKVSIARSIAEELRSIGITVELHEMPWNDYVTALEEGEFDMYLGEVMLTADFNLGTLLREEAPLNYGGITDAGYAARIDEYLAADDTQRAVACSNMCQYIVANSPIIPIAFEGRELVTHRGVLTGIELSPYNVFLNIQDWKLNN